MDLLVVDYTESEKALEQHQHVPQVSLDKVFFVTVFLRKCCSEKPLVSREIYTVGIQGIVLFHSTRKQPQHLVLSFLILESVGLGAFGVESEPRVRSRTLSYLPIVYQ